MESEGKITGHTRRPFSRCPERRPRRSAYLMKEVWVKEVESWCLPKTPRTAEKFMGWQSLSCKSVFAGQGEFQGDVGLKLRGTFVLAIRFVAPLAHSIGSGGGQERVSTEGAH